MSEQDEIAEALIKVADGKPTQAKLLRRYFDSIQISLDDGATLAELLKVLTAKTGINFGLRWAYEVLQKERKKRVGKESPSKSRKTIQKTEQTHNQKTRTSLERVEDIPSAEHSNPIQTKPSTDELLKIPLADLPESLRQISTIEVNGETYDIRPSKPPYVPFGDEHDQVRFAAEMKERGLSDDSDVYAAELTKLREQGKIRKAYIKQRQLFLAKAREFSQTPSPPDPISNET